MQSIYITYEKNFMKIVIYDKKLFRFVRMTIVKKLYMAKIVHLSFTVKKTIKNEKDYMNFRNKIGLKQMFLLIQLTKIAV